MKKPLATLAVMSLLAALAIAASTALGSDSATTSATKTISVDDNVFARGSNDFDPGDRYRVAAGTKLVFEWVGSNTHNVTGLRKGREVFASRDTDETGFRYPKTGAKTFRRDTTIVCTVHPSTMRFKVDVR
jgi:plastocyanin